MMRNSNAIVTEMNTKRLHRHKLPSGVLGAELHPIEDQVFAACLDGVYQCDLETGKCELLYKHDSYASGVVCDSSGKVLVSAGYDGRLSWYDLETRKKIHEVNAHSFWSWDLARSRDGSVVASSSGQYLAGDYSYRPLPATEPCVRVFGGIRGEALGEYDLGPPVQAVAVSASGRYVAAGNLMGDVGVWEVGVGKVAQWNSPDFTAFGIIKSHCQIGGIYAITFADDEQEVIVAGMGPMHDPMAGNGKQRWQRFRWSGEKPEKLSQAKDDQVGEGLMETIAMHPTGEFFVMAGRLRGGAWNAGIFKVDSGDLIHSIKSDKRVTKALFSEDGQRLLLCGAVTQPQNSEQEFGIVDVYKIETA